MIKPAVRPLMQSNISLAATGDPDWARLPEKKRQQVADRLLFIKPILEQSCRTGSAAAAIDNFLLRAKAGALPPQLTEAATRISKAGKLPSKATLYNWIKAYQSLGLMGLVPSHKGSERAAYGWEVRAMNLFNKPSKPSYAAVAEWLRDEGHASATYHRVRAYLEALPAHMSEFSAKRLGTNLHRDTQKHFVRRNTESLPVGFIYQGDGHTADVYIAHPATGKIWRPEITAWMDIRSRYLVGWFISESESALTTLFALSHALITHDHVPAMLHIDNGAGFKSKMVNDDSLGFYARFDIEPMFSIPRNAKGKGQIERWFRTLEEREGKRWDTYCGADMAPEVLQKITRDVNSGKRNLPSIDEYKAGLDAFVDRYNNTPHSALDDKTPAEVWATLERTPLHTPDMAICRPHKEVSVRRQAVVLHKREYTAPDLIAYNGKKLVAEYSVHDDSAIRMLDTQGRWICDAKLVNKKDYLPSSRIEEAQNRRLTGQRKRLQKKLDEADARAHLGRTQEALLQNLDELTATVTNNIEQKESDELTPAMDFDLDFLSTDY